MLTYSFGSNFLYNPDLREGVLVDFGLAEVSRSASHTRRHLTDLRS